MLFKQRIFTNTMCIGYLFIILSTMQIFKLLVLNMQSCFWLERIALFHLSYQVDEILLVRIMFFCSVPCVSEKNAAWLLVCCCQLLDFNNF
jgi:hypothetical protein